jgi:hypothetical protein
LITETNIYPILDLAGLHARFRLYRVKGLRPEQAEFHQNCQQLRRALGRAMGFRPMEVLKRPEGAFVALSEECPEPPEQIILIRAQVGFERQPQSIDVEFGKLTVETQPLALRLLQSAVQDKLVTDGRLWRPGAGGMFFEKQACVTGNEVGLHRGFVVRVAPTPKGGLGLCVDLRSRFIAQSPLNPRIRPNDLGRVKMRTFVYHYGHAWYEIQIVDVSEFNVQQYRCGETKAKRPLLDWILENCRKPLPKEMTTLQKDGSVIEYETNDGERRGAPAELCFEIFDTQAPQVRREHGRTILPPHGRQYELELVIRTYLSSFRLGNATLRVDKVPEPTKEIPFTIPDYVFGANRRLSVRGTPEASNVNLRELGAARLRLLEDKSAGFFSRGPLLYQYLFVPASVHNSWGPVFTAAVRQNVDQLFPTENGYNPKIVVYDDRHATNYVLHGQAILGAAEAQNVKGGYAVVMLADDRRPIGREDQLAALVMSKLGSIDVLASIIHASSGAEFYEFNQNGQRYESRRGAGGRLRGYLRNVALNKILLSSNKWPFILATPLHADIIVGIDVKGNTAGFTVVSKTGEHIFTRTRISRQKEKLLADQCRQFMVEGVREVAKLAGIQPREIVIHRDGRLFETELAGIIDAMKDLKDVLADDARVTCLDIPKTSFTSLRLFNREEGRKGAFYSNPEIGSYVILGVNDGYLCTTGQSFLRNGTVKPLHVRRVYGEMALRECLEDVFFLASLTWTQPEGCARDPISIKLNDRQLFEAATPFDNDAFEFAPLNREEKANE